MKAIRKKPGCAPELIDIDNTLKALQAEVEGYIEVITLPYGAALICNEEGCILGLPDNGRVCGVDVVGTVLIVGTKGDEFCDVPEADFLMDLCGRTRNESQQLGR